MAALSGVLLLGFNGQWRRRPLPSNWGSIRAAVLRRDGYRCMAFLDDGSRCPGRDCEVDHIDEDGGDGLSNLQALCYWHHKRKTQAFARRKYVERMNVVRSRFPRVDEHPGRVV